MWEVQMFKVDRIKHYLPSHTSLLLGRYQIILFVDREREHFPVPLRAGFSFFLLTNQLVHCQLVLTGGLSLDALFNSSSYVTEELTTAAL